MKLMQTSQTSLEAVLMDVKTSSRCSTFVSSDAIHLEPGPVRMDKD